MEQSQQGRPNPQVIVIFGATGDLARRKLFPGLYRLFTSGLAPKDFRIIGSGRHPRGSEARFRELVREEVEEFGRDGTDMSKWKEFAERMTFAATADGFEELVAAADAAEAELGEGAERLLFLAIPPAAIAATVQQIAATGLQGDGRLVVEKPFGHDLTSARKLNALLQRCVPEQSIFRIDHYLGKEPALNIIAFRFANGLFEPVWNRRHVSNIQIDVPQKIGLQGRGDFYEQNGAYRDMVVTHLLQVLGFVAMEPPESFDAEALHRAKLAVFRNLRPITAGDAVYGQFEGYRDQDGVAADSEVETFVALRVAIDNERWNGVPVLLRTGKRLASSRGAVSVGIKDPEMSTFHCPPGHANEVVFELSDDPRVLVDLRAKVPGPAMTLANAELEVDVGDEFKTDPLEAYERLLLDVMNGDDTLFASADEIEALWAASAPLLENPPPVQPYAPGSWGPDAADELARPYGWSQGG